MPLMAASNHVRWGAIGFLLGGLVWVVSGLLIVFGSRIMGPHPVYFLLFVVALLLTSAGLIGLHALQEGSYGLIGQVGLYTVLLAFALQALGTVFCYLEAQPSCGSCLQWGSWLSLSGLCSTVSLPCKRRCCRAGTVWRSLPWCPSPWPY
jgi:hypothetical protein